MLTVKSDLKNGTLLLKTKVCFVLELFSIEQSPARYSAVSFAIFVALQALTPF